MIRKLVRGDNLDIVAPSSYIENYDDFEEGLEIIRSWGLVINNNDVISRKFGYFAGDDKTRSLEINKAQKSRFIFCAKGGWGASRLLEKDLVWNNGWFMGFSDTCSLLLSKYSSGSLGSIHGPLVTTLNREPSWSINRIKKLLFDGNVDDIAGTPLINGIAYGKVIVSNLTIATFLLGTNHLPNLENKILIFEDINEDIYKIDRMLTYWRISNSFKKISGIGFGNLTGSTSKNDESIKIKNLIMERLEEYNIPIIIDLPIGHIAGNAAIPLGFNSILNGNDGTLSVDLNIDF